MGSFVSLATLFLSLRYASLMFSESVGKSRSLALSFFLRMYVVSLFKARVRSLPIPPIVCFAPMILTVPLIRSQSKTFTHVSSMGLFLGLSSCLGIDSFVALRLGLDALSVLLLAL